MLDVIDLHHHHHHLYAISLPCPLKRLCLKLWSGRLAFNDVGDKVKTHQTKDLSPTSLLTSLNTLLEAMFPFPSSLGNLLLPSPLLGPIVQITRDLVVGLKDRDGVVPSSLETWEVGTVSDFIPVLGPVFVVFFWVVSVARGRIEADGDEE